MGVPPCGRCGAPDYPSHACVPVPRAPLPPESGLSFSERYQGTEWGARPATQYPPRNTPSHAAPAAPREELPRSRSASPLLGLGLAMVVSAAVIGLVAFAMVGFQQPNSVRDGLNAAYATTYTPRPTQARPSPRTVAPTSSPDTTHPAPTARPPTGTLNPATLPEDPVLAFAERIYRGDASFTVKSSGTVRLGAAETLFESQMAVDGPDRSGSYTYSVAGLRATTDMVVKDGVGYLRRKGEGWTREPFPSGMPGDFLEGLSGADVAMLTNVGVERRNGRVLHHLRLPRIDWSTLRGLIGDAIASDVREVSLDIWVTSDGVPVKARYTIDATYLEDGLQVDLSADLQYSFSEYGQPHPVTEPEHFIDGDTGPGSNS